MTIMDKLKGNHAHNHPIDAGAGAGNSGMHTGDTGNLSSTGGQNNTGASYGSGNGMQGGNPTSDYYNNTMDGNYGSGTGRQQYETYGQNTSTGAGYDQAGYNDSNTQNKAGHHGLLGKHGHHEAGSGADTQGSHGNRHTVLGPGGMTGNTSGMSSGDNYGGMTGNTSGMSSGDNYGSGTGSTGQNYGSGAEGMGRTDHNHRGNNDNLASDQGRSKSGGLFSKKSEGDGIESALERERSAQRELDAAIAKHHAAQSDAESQLTARESAARAEFEAAERKLQEAQAMRSQRR